MPAGRGFPGPLSSAGQRAFLHHARKISETNGIIRSIGSHRRISDNIRIEPLNTVRLLLAQHLDSNRFDKSLRPRLPAVRLEYVPHHRETGLLESKNGHILFLGARILYFRYSLVVLGLLKFLLPLR